MDGGLANDTLRGVTFIELITWLAITGIVVGFGAPAMRETVLNARRHTRLNDMVMSIQFARSEAIKSGQIAVICPSSDGFECQSELGWAVGWIVFLNLDRDEPPKVDSDEPVLFHNALVTTHGRIESNRKAYRFRPLSWRSTNGTLTFCDSRDAAAARAVIVSYSGRPRISAVRPDGRPLECT
jgi:type IV fimbrial biogenesis protein FimT